MGDGRWEERLRDEVPVWRQAIEGIGLVVFISIAVLAVGALMSVLAALVF